VHTSFLSLRINYLVHTLLQVTCEDRNDDHLAGLPRLFVGRLAIQSSLKSMGCFCSCHLHNSQTKSTNWTCRPSLSDEDAVYMHKSVVRGHHICKRVWSPILFARLPIRKIARYYYYS